MFKISSTADLMRAYVGEALPFEVQLADDTGNVDNLISTGRSLVFAIYDGAGTDDLLYQEGDLQSDASGDFAQWIIPGSVTETFRGKSNLRWDLAERLAGGSRDVLMTGTLVLDASAPRVDSYDNAPLTHYMTRIKRMCDATDGVLLPTYEFRVSRFSSAITMGLEANFSRADNSGLLALF